MGYLKKLYWKLADRHWFNERISPEAKLVTKRILTQMDKKNTQTGEQVHSGELPVLLHDGHRVCSKKISWRINTERRTSEVWLYGPRTYFILEVIEYLRGHSGFRKRIWIHNMSEIS